MPCIMIAFYGLDVLMSSFTRNIFIMLMTIQSYAACIAEGWSNFVLFQKDSKIHFLIPYKNDKRKTKVKVGIPFFQALR